MIRSSNAFALHILLHRDFSCIPSAAIQASSSGDGNCCSTSFCLSGTPHMKYKAFFHNGFLSMPERKSKYYININDE